MKATRIFLTATLLVAVLLAAPTPTVRGHERQVQVSGDYEITYFSTPSDPIVNSPATLFVQARNFPSGEQLQVLHFLVQMIPPSGPRLFLHPLSNSTVFTFNQAGNWVLLLEVGVRNLAAFDATATFVADVSQTGSGSLFASFLNILVATVPRTSARWGHIVAVVLWLGMMLHISNTYRLSSRDPAGYAIFARSYKKADLVVALAVGLLVLTGIVRAFAHGLTTISSLFASDFGLVLFVKISLASGMILIGLFNRAVLLKKLEHSSYKGSSTGSGPRGLSDDTTRLMSRRIYYLTMLEMGLGITAILFGTIFTQIHTVT